MKKIIFILGVLICLSGCGKSESKEIVGSATVIIATQDAEILNKSVSFTANSTAYDITISAANESNMKLVFEGSGQAAYLTAVDDLAAGDFGSMSGWMFDINDAPSNYGCGTYKVQDGDVIRWYYVEDFMAVQ